MPTWPDEPGAFPCVWAAARKPRVPGTVSGSSPGSRVCWPWLVPCVGEVCGWLFFIWSCYLPFVAVTLASFLAALIVCGFQAKILENVPSQRALCKVGAWGRAERWAVGDVLRALCTGSSLCQKGQRRGAEASGSSLLRWEGDTLMGLGLLSCIFQRNQET